MIRLGVVVPLKTEARGLVKKPMVMGELLLLPEGTIVKLSGMGMKLARLAAETLLEKGVTALLSWGSAGGLYAALSAGSLVLPERVLSSDQVSFPVDAAWHERLSTRLSGHVDIHTGPIFQSSVVLRSPAEKTALFKKCGAIAVDMESAAVARVALQAKLPFMTMRAISDPADTALPASALAATDECGRLRPFRLLKNLVRHPRELFPLVRLGRNFRAAQSTLSTVVLLTGHRLLAP